MSTMVARQPRLFHCDRFEEWLKFHKKNPRVWIHFRDLSRQAFRSGRKVGARCVWENIRWKMQIAERSDDGFVMNNNHAPYYARLLMLRHPELDGYFERRDSRFDVDDATLLNEANAIDQAREIFA